MTNKNFLEFKREVRNAERKLARGLSYIRQTSKAWRPNPWDDYERELLNYLEYLVHSGKRLDFEAFKKIELEWYFNHEFKRLMK